jgi:DNA-binding NtrC family response regulator
MPQGSKQPRRSSRRGLGIPRVWQMIQSLVGGAIPNRMGLPSRIPVVALVVSAQDRNVLASVSGQKPLDVHFAESCEEGWAVAAQLTAPVILFDRDWPKTEWRMAVKSLAASPHRPCVVLMSGVADDYLWQELIRRGGYDVLPKPLRADNVARIVRLALSYWNSVPKPAVPARRGR